MNTNTNTRTHTNTPMLRLALSWHASRWKERQRRGGSKAHQQRLLEWARCWQWERMCKWKKWHRISVAHFRRKLAGFPSTLRMLSPKKAEYSNHGFSHRQYGPAFIKQKPLAHASKFIGWPARNSTNASFHWNGILRYRVICAYERRKVDRIFLLEHFNSDRAENAHHQDWLESERFSHLFICLDHTAARSRWIWPSWYTCDHSCMSDWSNASNNSMDNFL